MNPQQQTASLAEIVRFRIRRLRLERYLTQEQLCEKAGISIDAVNRIENGNRSPNLDTLERIANALRVTPSVLIGDLKKPDTIKTPSIQRTINLLENVSTNVQVTVEKVVKSFILHIANIQPETASKSAEEKADYSATSLSVNVLKRTIFYKGLQLMVSDGELFTTLLVLSINPGKTFTLATLASEIEGFGVQVKFPLTPIEFREKLLRPTIDTLESSELIKELKSIIKIHGKKLKLDLNRDEVRVLTSDIIHVNF